MLNLTSFAGEIENGGQEMQRLTAEKVHGADGFQEDRRRSGHASFDNGVGDSFQEREIIENKIHSNAQLYREDELLCSAEMTAVAGNRESLLYVSPRRPPT